LPQVAHNLFAFGKMIKPPSVTSSSWLSAFRLNHFLSIDQANPKFLEYKQNIWKKYILGKQAPSSDIYSLHADSLYGGLSSLVSMIWKTKSYLDILHCLLFFSLIDWPFKWRDKVLKCTRCNPITWKWTHVHSPEYFKLIHLRRSCIRILQRSTGNRVLYSGRERLLFIPSRLEIFVIAEYPSFPNLRLHVFADSRFGLPLSYPGRTALAMNLASMPPTDHYKFEDLW